MKSLVRSVALLGAVLLLPACAASYVSTWKDPQAGPLQFRDAKVAAVVMLQDESSRRVAEDTLAREISARGAQGIAMYTLAADGDPSREAAARAALEREGVVGAVVMRPVSREQSLRVTPLSMVGPPYFSYWGGYYGHGWASPWRFGGAMRPDVSVDTVVTVETLVYSLRQNRLIWGGTSKTTNPPRVETFIHQLAGKAAAQLEKEGLLAP